MKNRILIATLACLIVTTGAFAQRGPAPTNGGGHGPEMGMGMGEHGPDSGLIIASNGTVILSSGTYDSATNTSTTTLKAISSSGAVLWTQTYTNLRAQFQLSGSNLLSVTEVAATDGTVTSTITAISIATGTTAWTKTINGRVQDLKPFNGGTYAIVIVPAATTGGSATRTLVAISDSGATLWSINI